MRSSSDPLLGPHASKQTALEHITRGLALKNGHTSAARIARECLDRYLLSYEENLLVATALLAGSARGDDTDRGEALWRLNVAHLVRHGKVGGVVGSALRLASNFLIRKDVKRMYAALERAQPYVEKLPRHHAGFLHYASMVEEYLRLSDDTDGAGRLLPR